MSLKNFLLQSVRRDAKKAILAKAPEHDQLNISRKALVSLIERIPENERSEAEKLLIDQDNEIQVFRDQSNELETLINSKKSDKELSKINATFSPDP